MNPNIAKRGTSFRGAALYYFHDKAADPKAEKSEKPKTADRVVFVATRNTVSNDPDRAIDEMWLTAASQQSLKRQAGVSLGGRTCTNPVQTISLAWHPSEKPSHDTMIAAADSFLKYMGWDEHQAIYVGHNDTAHKHVHLIVNRIHPETGRVYDGRSDHRRAQAWAHEYEKEFGKVWCNKRAETANQNRYAANTDLPHEYVHAAREQEAALIAQDERFAAELKQEADRCKQEQREEREAWMADGRKKMKELRHSVYQEVRAEFKDEWRNHFKAEKEQLAAVREAAALEAGKAVLAAKQGAWSDMDTALRSRQSMEQRVMAQFKARKARIREKLLAEARKRQEKACADLSDERYSQYKELLKRQLRTRDHMRRLHGENRSAATLLRDPKQPAPANENKIEPQNGTPRPAEVPRAFPYGPDTRPESKKKRPRHEHPTHDYNPGGIKPLTDAPATAVLAAAHYLSEQLFEFFSPTPQHVREERAAEAAEKAAAAPKPPQEPNPFAAQIAAALRVAEEEQKRRDNEAYWEQRDRERDR